MLRYKLHSSLLWRRNILCDEIVALSLKTRQVAVQVVEPFQFAGNFGINQLKMFRQALTGGCLVPACWQRSGSLPAI